MCSPNLSPSLYATRKRYFSRTSHPGMIRHRMRSPNWTCVSRPGFDPDTRATAWRNGAAPGGWRPAFATSARLARTKPAVRNLAGRSRCPDNSREYFCFRKVTSHVTVPPILLPNFAAPMSPQHARTSIVARPVRDDGRFRDAFRDPIVRGRSIAINKREQLTRSPPPAAW